MDRPGRHAAASPPRNAQSAGFVAAHAVIGRAGDQLRNRPISSTVSIMIRCSVPPSRRYCPASSASVSRVTPCATIRPPAASACQHPSSTPSVTPPPMNTASGVGSAARFSAASPSTTLTSPGASRSMLRRARAARRGLRSTPIAVAPGAARHHSIAIAPEPVPMSHRSSPGSGRRKANAWARTWRLVINPSCSNASSGRPGRTPIAATDSGLSSGSLDSLTSGRLPVDATAPPQTVRPTQIRVRPTQEIR